MATIIVRFDNVASRDAFLKELGERSEHILQVGEFIPDVILRDISEEFVAKVRRLVPNARIVADFAHDLFKGQKS